MGAAAGEFETIIIGAGAAGLSAARRLAAAGVKTQVFEARGRIGGRAHTERRSGFPLDLGCGWLHSADRNPWTQIAEAEGFAIDRTTPAWMRQSLDLGFSPEDQASFAKANARFHARLEAFGAKAPDKAAASLVEDEHQWRALLNAESAFVSGAELDRVSAQDLKNYAEADTGVNWRVFEGYGAAITAYGAGAHVVLDCAVTQIDWSGSRVSVETARGAAKADAVLVTVPSALIAAQMIKFLPSLPEKTEAASALPLGLADKLVMVLDAPEIFPVDGHLFGNPRRTDTGSYHLRPFGRPLIEVFFGGALAQDLEAAGAGAFFDFAVEEIAQLVGSSIRSKLRLLSETNWGRDPFARGSYSYARPGGAKARALLAAPVEDRLFFAGEACSRSHFSTAHGAYFSGLEAAEQIIELKVRGSFTRAKL